jgi:hypothetical protein
MEVGMMNSFWRVSTLRAAAAAGVLAAGFVTAGIGLDAAGAVAAGASHDARASRPTHGARGEPHERLGELIERGIRAEGPFFTPEERAVIERACGYPAGSWDGYEANMQNGVFVCTNGRRVESPEVRAVMEAAGPRIGERVRRTMTSAEVQGAIREVAAEAQAEALRGIDAAEIGRQAAARAEAEVERAMAEVERDLADMRRERRR